MLKRCIVLVVLVLVLLPPCSWAQDEWKDIPKVVVIGDLHGDYDQYIKILRLNKLIDKRLRWSGGKTHLVQLGDVPDRGPDTFKIMNHLMRLESEARHAGGYVHALIGNHEAMNIEGDLRYVNPDAYKALVTWRSSQAQSRYINRVFKYLVGKQPELAKEKDKTYAALRKQFPPGYVEYRAHWLPDQALRRWVDEHNTVIKIDRTLFVHGGIDPHQPLKSIDEINREVRQALSGNDPGAPNLTNDENGPLWYRGLALHDAPTELESLRKMLEYYDADRIVVGHTPTATGRVVARFNGMVIMDDVGITSVYGGHLANLIVEGSRLFEVTPDGKSELTLE